MVKSAIQIKLNCINPVQMELYFRGFGLCASGSRKSSRLPECSSHRKLAQQPEAV
ncbi:hypothetical protein M9458_000520, partial [Cirrhinus mrigala]